MEFREGITVFYEGSWPEKEMETIRRIIKDLPLTVRSCDINANEIPQVNLLISRESFHIGGFAVRFKSEGPIRYYGLEDLSAKNYAVQYRIQNEKSFLAITDKKSGIMLSLERKV